MEIKLKENQLAILSGIAQNKQLLQAKFGELVQKENELVLSILEALDVIPQEGTRIEDGKIIIPEPSNYIGSDVPEKPIKLKKSK